MSEPLSYRERHPCLAPQTVAARSTGQFRLARRVPMWGPLLKQRLYGLVDPSVEEASPFSASRRPWRPC